MTASMALLLAAFLCPCPWVEIVDCRDEAACPGPSAHAERPKRNPDRPGFSVVVGSYLRTLVEQRSVAAIGTRPGAPPLHVITATPLGSTYHGSVVSVRAPSDAVQAAQKRGREVNVVKLTESSPPKDWASADGTWVIVETGTVRETPPGPRHPAEWKFVPDGNSEYRVVPGKDGALTFELRSVLAL